MTDYELMLIQEGLEYEFNEQKLLRQAFTRKSYSEEGNGAHHNEVLEFYGDKVLEFIVMKKLSSYYGDESLNGKYVSLKTEGQLTDIKKKLICRKMLAHRIDVLGFAEYLLMGKSDIGQNAQNIDSVKEDLFEAIIGAVAIDSNWDVEYLEEVVDVMLDIEHYLENGFDDSKNYVDLIQEWCQKKHGLLPYYEFNEEDDGFGCSLFIADNYDAFDGYGISKREARMEAAREAYETLEEDDELILPIDEVGKPDFDRAINQLQELYQKGYIEEPEYIFTESYDDDGNPEWLCECFVLGHGSWEGKYSSKKFGKKSVAYSMLCEILDVEEE